ncbi:MAG TPA: response regulator [Noviherbaspirillum sp.]|jgi:CheY-like chemotaxis protein/signal transduction histidine kinase|uniref:response regulator n=1 Tax=Noviherbaspirillum sp. TaxID=1926288 RepID=UPI002F93216F
MPVRDHTHRYAYSYIFGVMLLVFLIDSLTPLGFAEWVFYILPVALCVLDRRPQLPVVVTLVMMPLLVMGYLLSPKGANETMALVNRMLAVFVVIAVAWLARRVIVERVQAEHLMWIERGRAEVSRNMLGEPTVQEVAERILHALARYFGAQVAVLYRREGMELVRTASFALDPDNTRERIPLGAGLAGEVARDGQAMVVSDLPAEYLRVVSGIGQAQPAKALIVPVFAGGQTTGVIEFGFLQSRGLDVDLDAERELMGLVADKIGSAMRSAVYRQELKDLLAETQRQSEELQAQQEELRVANEELGEQANALQQSQAQMELQHSELEQANVQLEERNQLLEQQKRALNEAQLRLQSTAEELERGSRYKSEFLANMSHELRTPLNSSLILSHLLAENKSGTLTEEQVGYARTIHASNSDLLALINDILDLSKIEAGQMEVHSEPVAIEALFDTLRRTFDPVAQQKGLALSFQRRPGTPDALVTDSQRLQQVLRNLLSNACKFTHEGRIDVECGPGSDGRLRFSVHDTGIGIPEEQQQVIFEAFRQADGSTSRAYGGTGLGLSISRELARLLGGELHVQSRAGAGSHFYIELPPAPAEPGTKAPETAAPTPPAAPPAPEAVPAPVGRATMPQPVHVAAIPDDRAQRQRDRMILVIEDDPHFARILYQLAHEMNFDCLHAPTGEEAVRLAEEHKPHGILLDISLPDQSGLSVLERIKRNPATRHLPVHVISVDDYMQSAFELGAVGYALKPVAREQLVLAIKRLETVSQSRARRVLIIEDNAALRESIAKMLAAEDIEISNAGSMAEALEKLSASTFDCMVMDLMLPDGSGYDLLEQISQNGKYAFPPVIVYTGRELSRDEEQRLRRFSRSIIIKGARSPERLLDEVSLFLHRVESELPPDQRRMLMQARQRDAVFEGRKILLAEDDVRNVFALASVFEPLGAELVVARNGREALARLEEREDIDLVLMDLMMPEMDGLTAIRTLRAEPRFKRLPVIALTAKAMADDRRNCLEAGASDYIAKPIAVDQLVSLCRVWMPK